MGGASDEGGDSLADDSDQSITPHFLRFSHLSYDRPWLTHYVSVSTLPDLKTFYFSPATVC